MYSIEITDAKVVKIKAAYDDDNVNNFHYIFIEKERLVFLNAHSGECTAYDTSDASMYICDICAQIHTPRGDDDDFTHVCDLCDIVMDCCN